MPRYLQKLFAHRLLNEAGAEGADTGGTGTTPPAAETPEVDEFTAMFDHLASGGDPSVEPGTAPAANKPEPPATETPDADSPEALEAASAAAAAAPAPAAPAPAPAAPAPAPAAPAPAPAAEPAAAPAPAAPAPAPAAPAFQLYTPEEQTQLDTLKTEWPDIDKLIELKMRKLQLDTLTTAFAEINTRTAPLAAHVDYAQGNTHLAQIYEGHADYDQVYQPYRDWVATLPAYLKGAHEKVMAEGTSDDVVEAIQAFKDATKWQAPAATPAAAPAAAPAAQPRQLSEAARKAAGALAPVNTKRSAQPMGGDPNDFDAAWSEANAT